MKLLILSFLVLSFNSIHSQVTTEVLGVVTSAFLKDDFLVGTSSNFDDFGAYSSVNLKNTINSGIKIQFQRSFKKSRFFYFGSLEENIVRYESTVYHPKHGLSDEFNNSERLVFKNNNVNLGLGLFSRFSFFNKILEWDIGFQIKHRHFRDAEIVKRKSENPEFFGAESGDLKYDVKLDFQSANSSLVFNPFTSVSFKIANKLSCQLLFSLVTPTNVYFNTRVSGYTKFDGGPVVGSWSGQDFGRFDVQTNSISFGLGVKYKIGR